MKLNWRYAVYLVLALAVVGVVALIWFGLHRLATVVALLFGGGAKALQRYAGADVRKLQRDRVIDAQEDAAEHLHQAQQAEDFATGQQEKARDDGQTRSSIEGAETQKHLDDAVERATREASEYYDRHGEDGFVRLGFCLYLALAALCMIAIVPPAALSSSKAPTDAQKARVKKLLDVIKRGVRAHKALRRKYKRDMKLMRVRLKLLQKRRSSEQQACVEKLAALQMRRCPPSWPAGVLGFGAGALLCAASIGIYAGVRR